MALLPYQLAGNTEIVLEGSSVEKDQQLEGNFYQYMHQSGEVDPEWNREVLSYYVPYFAHCKRVLDIGCGQGDFLELLQEAGVEGIGIDVDTRMVDTCLQKGLNAIQADIFDYLPKCEGEFDGIFNSNLIEHFSAERATRFVHLAFDALAPEGIFLVATPNPASLIVHLHEFWRDATHVRLYNRSLLEFLLDWAGFEALESGENPVTIWEPYPTFKAVPELMEDVSSHRGLLQWDLAWPDETPPPIEQHRSFLQRWAFKLRRRIARFLVETVLFEEFISLNKSLHEMNKILGWRFDTLRAAFSAGQRIDQAVYESQKRILTIPREIFAKGVKSPIELVELEE